MEDENVCEKRIKDRKRVKKKTNAAVYHYAVIAILFQWQHVAV